MQSSGFILTTYESRSLGMRLKMMGTDEAGAPIITLGSVYGCCNFLNHARLTLS
jgi:hypothetical protein